MSELCYDNSEGVNSCVQGIAFLPAEAAATYCPTMRHSDVKSFGRK
jgi:hypothetical protein